MISTRNKKNKPTEMTSPQIGEDGTAAKNETASMTEADGVGLLLKNVRAGAV